MPDHGQIVMNGKRTTSERRLNAASKMALFGKTWAWPSELAPSCIALIMIGPGATDTQLLFDPARGGVQPVLSSFGRYVQPEEVGAVAACLGPTRVSAATASRYWCVATPRDERHFHFGRHNARVATNAEE